VAVFVPGVKVTPPGKLPLIKVILGFGKPVAVMLKVEPAVPVVKVVLSALVKVGG
jgi:hypothetical protein